MQETPLTPRLKLAASLVRPGVRVADIGTDHAYIPIALLRAGQVRSAVATDLREGPLARARQNAARYGVANALSLRCCDGLAAVRPDEADDIVIAGMGGELIAAIVAAADWLRDPAKRLILQPMSSAEDLRGYLRTHSFLIEREVPVTDNDRVYTVMLARYSATEQNDTFPGFDFVGALDVKSPEGAAYARRQLRHLTRIWGGQRVKDDPAAADTLTMIRTIASRMDGHPVVFAGEIYDEIDRFAPFATAMDFDNPGLLVGSRDQIVEKVMIALDITPQVVREAVSRGASLIISHHPVIFDPLRTLPEAHPAYMMAHHRLTAICAHTNLDMAPGGVNTCLAEALRLQNCRPFAWYHDLPEGLLGTLPTPQSAEAFARYVRDRLGGGVQWVDGGRTVHTVALCGGAGGNLTTQAVQAGADAFVTGEVRHHQLLEAQAAGLTLVAAGHYCTERVVLEPLRQRLAEAFPAVEFMCAETVSDPAHTIA